MKKNKLFVLGMVSVALSFMVFTDCSKKEAGTAAANVLKSLPKGAIGTSKVVLVLLIHLLLLPFRKALSK